MVRRKRDRPDVTALVTVPAARDGDPLATLSDETLRRARRIARQGESANTRSTYQSGVAYWSAWHYHRKGCAMTLPVPIATVVEFLTDHLVTVDDDGMTTSHGLPDEVDQALIAAGRKIKAGAPALNTVLLRLSVLSKLHTLRAKGQPNPCMDPHIRLLVQRAKSGYAQREQRLVNQKPALLQEHLDALLDTCKEDSLIDLRDRALLLLAWTSGGRRRSEVSRARMSQLKKHSKGYQLNIGVSKTNQTGEHRAGNLKPVIGQAAEALTRWLERSGVKSGPIFRRIRVHGGAEEVTVSPLTGHAIREIVMARAQTAGLGDAGFSAHSLRSGFVTTAADRNAPINIIMSLAGMADVKTVSRYFRSLDDRNEEALRKILGEEEPER